MKSFLITTLTLCSLISSAQTAGKTGNETLLTDNSPRPQYRIENNNSFSSIQETQSGINPAIAESTSSDTNFENAGFQTNSANTQDSLFQKSSDYRIWYKLSLVEFGFNYTTAFTPAATSGKPEYGQALLNYSMGFHSLGGLGFGTKLIVYYPIPGNVEIHSWFPLYVHFPVYISRKKTKPFTRVPDTFNVPFMINLYAGGSLWGTTSSSYSISKGAFLPDKFYHIGVNCMFLNYSLRQLGFLNGNIALDTGMIFFRNTDSAVTSVYNIGLIYSFAGSARIMYK